MEGVFYLHRLQDQHGYTVEVAFQQGAFSIKPEHVFVICRYDDKWLFTKHKKRGLEFPGGKVERGESCDQAAIRETFEETGGVIKNLQCIGEYKVYHHPPFVKAIYYAEIEKLVKKEDYQETDGPILWEEDLDSIHHDSRFSFIMKDAVVPLAVTYVKKQL